MGVNMDAITILLDRGWTIELSGIDGKYQCIVARRKMTSEPESVEIKSDRLKGKVTTIYDPTHYILDIEEESLSLAKTHAVDLANNLDQEVGYIG